jgi:flagellar basal-body rod protein FlgF
MSGGMYLAAAGALVQQLRLEVLANNVANINTAGFKGEQSVFEIPEASENQMFETPVEGVQSLLSPTHPLLRR